MMYARFIEEENVEFTMLVFLDRLSWVDCISPATFRDFLILCPSTPLSREQTGAAGCKKESVKSTFRIKKILAVTILDSCEFSSGYNTSRRLVGVLFGSLSVAEASCPLCSSGSSLVRVRSDPTELRQPIVEPSLISWTVKESIQTHSDNKIPLKQCQSTVTVTWKCRL